MVGELPTLEERYRALLEHIPAVVFMAYLDRGIGEAYVSPQIEATLGFSQAEWLEDPVRWYKQIHAEEKARWSAEAAQMFLTGKPLRSVYRVMARDGHVVWFHCEANMVRRADGQPWFIHGVGFDISDLKRTEEELRQSEERSRLLEKNILEISAREQRRIGQDLHDGLGQHLTGIAFMSKVLAERLSDKGDAEASEARKIVKLVNEAIQKTRELAHGLLPVVSESHGLMSALQQLASEVEDVFHIECRLECEPPVMIHDVTVATHLYHVAQEAVSNAFRHGRAQRIAICLSAKNGSGELAIEDDGIGIAEITPSQRGMGLAIMSHRARIIGGAIQVRSEANRGTRIVCVFPIPTSG